LAFRTQPVGAHSLSLSLSAGPDNGRRAESKRWGWRSKTEGGREGETEGEGERGRNGRI